MTTYVENGLVVEENHPYKRYYHHDFNGHAALHNPNGPAVIRYYKDGSISCESYYTYGELQSIDDKPAHISYNPDGSIFEQKYLKNGTFHRDGDLPAYIHTYDNGSEYFKYYVNGKLHRTNGPAIFSKQNGALRKSSFEYWVDGKIMGKRTFMNKYFPIAESEKTYKIKGKTYKIINSVDDVLILKEYKP